MRHYPVRLAFTLKPICEDPAIAVLSHPEDDFAQGAAAEPAHAVLSRPRDTTREQSQCKTRTRGNILL